MFHFNAVGLSPLVKKWSPPRRARGAHFVSLELLYAPLSATPRKPCLLGTHFEQVPTAIGRGPSRGDEGKTEPALPLIVCPPKKRDRLVTVIAFLVRIPYSAPPVAS